MNRVESCEKHSGKKERVRLLDTITMRLAVLLDEAGTRWAESREPATADPASRTSGGAGYWRIKIQTDHLLHLVESIGTNDLKAPAQAFVDNIEATTGVLVLPQLLMSMAFDPLTFSQEAQTPWTLAKIKWAHLKSLVMLERMEKLDNAQRFLRALMLQCTVGAWMAFEILADDVLEVLVDSGHGPPRRGERRPRAVGSLERIGRVYGEVLGTRSDTEAIFANENLGQLQQLRHLIVHRSGIIDETYARASGLDPTLVGTPVRPDSMLVSEHLNLVADAGAKLVRLADDWLTRSRPSV